MIALMVVVVYELLQCCSKFLRTVVIIKLYHVSHTTMIMLYFALCLWMILPALTLEAPPEVM
jgi:hypothetical protein